MGQFPVISTFVRKPSSTSLLTPTQSFVLGNKLKQKLPLFHRTLLLLPRPFESAWEMVLKIAQK